MKFVKSLALGLLFATGAAFANSIDINTADAKSLEELKGIGPAKAQAIVDYRTQNGPFKSVDDLQKVPGIKAATVDKNRDLAVVASGGPTKSAKADKPVKSTK